MIALYRFLKKSGANVDFCKLDGASPLDTAYENGHESTVQFRIGGDINSCKENRARLSI